MTKPTTDPLRINPRLYRQMDKLLKRLERDDEEITTPQLINAIKMIAQVMILQNNLRLKTNESDSPGSAVRKYATAFKTNAARGRKVATGTGNVIDLLSDTPDDSGE